MHEPTHNVTVEDLYDDQLPQGSIVDDTHPLSDIASTFYYQDATHALYVVDTQDRYAGTITRTTLLEWIQHNHPTPHDPTTGPLETQLQDAQAQDAIHPQSANIPIEPHEPTTHALQTMIAARIPSVPVVDANGTIQGHILLARILQNTLDD